MQYICEWKIVQDSLSYLSQMILQSDLEVLIGITSCWMYKYIDKRWKIASEQNGRKYKQNIISSCVDLIE